MRVGEGEGGLLKVPCDQEPVSVQLRTQELADRFWLLLKKTSLSEACLPGFGVRLLLPRVVFLLSSPSQSFSFHLFSEVMLRS